MNRVNVICEGETEERFVKDLLAPHLYPRQVFLNPILLGRGNSYQKFEREVILISKRDGSAYLTTMIDLYGMNEEFPGYGSVFSISKEHRATHIATEIEQALSPRLIRPEQTKIYVQLHEFEALLFSEPKKLHAHLSLDGRIPLAEIESISASFDTPEHINDHPEKAPSKRIIRLAPSYNKPADGFTIAKNIGLERIRAACPNFDHWLTWLESLGV